MFIEFMRKVLRWLPEERPTAGELVYDDFLMQAVLAFTTRANIHLSVLDL
jgi:serine/threonine-protein kinase SRPK3